MQQKPIADGTERHPRPLARRVGEAAAFVVLILSSIALWCGLTGSFSGQELLVGAVSAALTTAFLGALLRTSRLRARFAARDLLLVWRLPADIAKDCGVILRVFVRSVWRGQDCSLYRVCGFQTSRHDPLRVGRSALAIAYLSASPNTIVIGIDPDQSLMLYHQLEPDAMTTVGRRLGAQA